MTYHIWGLVVFLHVHLKLMVVLGQSSSSNLILTNFYWCKDMPHQPVHFVMKPKDYTPGFQHIDLNISLPETFGDGILAILSLELNTELTAKEIWIPLFKTEGDMCKMIDTYLGEIWYEMQRKMGMIQRSCPIARGSYHVINHLVDFGKLKLQGFPFGKTRVIVRYVKKATKETVACNVFEVSSKTHQYV